MKRKWIWLVAIASPLILVSLLVLYARGVGHRAYGFLRGAKLVAQNEIEYDSGSTRTVMIHRTYTLRADLAPTIAQMDADLLSDGWTADARTASSTFKSYAKPLAPGGPGPTITPPRVGTGPVIAILSGAPMRTILVSRGTPFGGYIVTSSAMITSYPTTQVQPVIDRAGQLTIEVDEPAGTPGWVDKLVEMFHPSKPKNRTVLRYTAGSGGVRLLYFSSGSSRAAASRKP